jgi:hypothetical protein
MQYTASAYMLQLRLQLRYLQTKLFLGHIMLAVHNRSTVGRKNSETTHLTVKSTIAVAVGHLLTRDRDQTRSAFKFRTKTCIC